MVAPADNPFDKRLAANRRNAQKSTGPRTDEGKARSSLNAVKHGLTAQTALLNGEDAEELRTFAESFEKHLRPMGPLQKILVQRIIAIGWKLRRVADAEAEAARAMDEEELRGWERQRDFKRELPFAPVKLRPRPQPRTGGRLLADSFREDGGGRDAPVDGPLVRITHYELKLEGALRADLRELRALQREDPFPTPEAEPEGGAEQVPEPSPAPEQVADATPAPSAPQAGRLNGSPGPTVDVVDDPEATTDTADGINAPSQNEPTPPALGADGKANDGAGP